jgi:hypothetical protein
MERLNETRLACARWPPLHLLSLQFFLRRNGVVSHFFLAPALQHKLVHSDGIDVSARSTEKIWAPSLTGVPPDLAVYFSVSPIKMFCLSSLFTVLFIGATFKSKSDSKGGWEGEGSWLAISYFNGIHKLLYFSTGQWILKFKYVDLNIFMWGS